MLQILYVHPFVTVTVFILAVFIILKIVKSRQPIFAQKSEYLLNFSERKFFEALTSAIGPKMYVCPKVRIADIVAVDMPLKKKEFMVNYKKISQKSVDFVIVKRSTFEPLLIVELVKEGENKKRQKLGRIMTERVFDEAGIPIIYIASQRFYDKEELKNVVVNAMQGEIDNY